MAHVLRICRDVQLNMKRSKKKNNLHTSAVRHGQLLLPPPVGDFRDYSTKINIYHDVMANQPPLFNAMNNDANEFLGMWYMQMSCYFYLHRRVCSLNVIFPS